MAQELITSKIGLRADLDASEEKADACFKELQALKRLFKETEESRTQIQSEAVKVWMVHTFFFYASHSSEHFIDLTVLSGCFFFVLASSGACLVTGEGDVAT